MKYAEHLGRPVPQTEKEDPRQVANNGGGFSFQVDDRGRFKRFLIMGSESGTFYVGERELTTANVDATKRLASVESDGLWAVEEAALVSEGGRAPKNEPAVLALAVLGRHGNAAVKAAALAALPRVCRIPTHLFHFVEFWKKLGGGHGRSVNRALQKWYLDGPVDRLALHAVKYQQRDGWSHRDLLRLARPKTADVTRNAVFNWMVKGWPEIGPQVHPDEALRLIWAFERAKTARGKELVRLISDHGLPHECVPNEAKGDPDVWAAMLPHMGLTALVRNLGKMTSVGLVKPMSAAAKTVATRLGDVQAMKKGRVHPLHLLQALSVYRQGHGDKGSLTWAPVPLVIDALDQGFYSAFAAVEPTGKRHCLAIDVSGSMDGSRIAGMSLSARECAAAMALVTAAVEPEHTIVGFSHKLVDLPISPRQRLDDVINMMRSIPYGATDCTLPIAVALRDKVMVDAFFCYTDSETNDHRSVHPHVALKDYRNRTGIAAKMAVVATSATDVSIADPTDAGMIDVAGFDTATPSVLADFVRG